MKTTIKHHEEENFIAQAVTRYLPYWPLFLLLLLITLDGAWVYLYMAKPLYESSARILIKDEKKGAEDSKAVEGIDLLSTKKIIENETEVLQSRTLLEEVVQNLGLYIPVTEEMRFKKRSAYSSSPVMIQGAYSESFPSQKKIYFTFDEHMPGVILNGSTYPIDQWVLTPYGSLRFVRNKNFQGSMPEGKLFFQMVDPKSVVASIQDKLKVGANNKQSSILTLTLLDEVPKRAEDILNGLLTVYNKAMINDKNIVAANTLASVETRLKSVEHDLDSIERKAEQYKSRRGVVDISEQGKLFLQNVSANDQKIGNVNVQLSVLDQAEQYVLSKNKAEGFVPSTAGISDPVLPNLIDKLYTLELEKETLKKTAGENNFAMTSITDRIDKIKPSILENIQNQRKTLKASSENIASANRSYSSMLQTMPEKERDLVEINRELSIKNSIYTFLLQKREETALSHASMVSDSRIIDKAQSGTSPVTPKPKVIWLSAFLLALLLGISFITLKEAFNQKVMFRNEIQKLSSSPVIGEISAHRSKDAIVTGASQKTFIAEQFRKLRTSLQFIGISGKRKRILVTSAISGEGKSFVSLNLAISLALTGKKVVLIDSDLNNPSLHKKLNVQHDKGLADYLLNEADEEEITRPTNVDPNLYFIATGMLPHNPSELIMNSRMEDLLDQLDVRFDYIVLDSAPVGLVTGTYLISPYCDATVFVVRHNYTPKMVVQQIDEENKINQLNNIGIVFNDVHTRGFGTNKYGYGYGSGYIYNDRNYYRLNKASK